ncbi:hypothetical protein MGWOODY_Tha1962 [hydrothermal vent metagenome]|uniref:Uncharacterized protein n=1 Tax=hydrothermal vent metagenome TaxID=652676 RepID=A0A160TDC3_9ZZZZ
MTDFGVLTETKALIVPSMPYNETMTNVTHVEYYTHKKSRI